MQEGKAMRVTVDDGVAEVMLIGPGKGNAMGPDFWLELPQVFQELDRDAAVHAVIVRGSGEHFSYGLDLMAMVGDLGRHFSGTQMAAERTDLLDLIVRLQDAVTSVERCRKPVIAAVHGRCIGGGLDLIAACDIRLAAANASFSLREVRLAIVADVGSLQRLPAIIGQGATRELAYTGKDIDAQRALQLGLVNDLLDTPEGLFQAARDMARQIADNPPVVVQGIKRVMGYCADKSVAAGLYHTAVWNSAFLQSTDLAEAIAAFAERRPPRFSAS